MFYKSKFLTALGLTTISLFLAANPAQAFTLVDRSGFTDGDFNNLLSNGEFTELFVAEGRIGNNSLNGDRELGINTSTGLPVASGQRVWGNGTPVNFTLEYTGTQVNYTVNGELLSSNAFTSVVDNIFLRTRAADDSSVTLSNLVFNSTAIGQNLLSSVSGAGSDIDYLQISDISSPFTLTGEILMTWTGTIPRNSRLAYQIKVGSTKSIPEPGAVGAMFLVGVAAVGYSKRKPLVKASV
ncbi:choice-of-anchor W domain-containing protein [Anabaena sp. UHCC 0399]|uniref:choice-of-anchor W domain-containing protein n=1 Tax=Anabaena sp. UHCC 0399 TaxID=3110238 RepID=UPI002B200430|nr:choice-of-anchor W domain-containing protein [Anabaena sp. UHCC 0399]MEA5568732.1 choice-of-anchor W domain-containing protein [Anabaena sp. UHCC 0399]